MELYKHQKEILDKNPDKYLLCHDTGSGKTITSIFWANQKKYPAIFICPKALKENWLRNLKTHCTVEFRVFTKEEFRRDWDIIEKFNSIIVDEAHHFAGMKSQMSKSLTKYLKKHKVENVLLLTATPYRSSPWDIYVLAKHLGYDWHYYRFFDKFFTEIFVGRGRKVPKVKPDIEQDIADLVGKIGSIIHINECADIPEQVFETEYFDLHEDQIKAKKEVYDANPIVRYTKHHEIENGFLKGDEYTPDNYYYHYKEDRILELAQDNDKIIIVCRYHGQMDLLKAELGQLNKPIFMISGKVPNRDEVVQQAEEAKKAIVIIQAACSEGYELPSFPLMVFASLDYSYVNYKQMVGRILRLNKLKKNVYIHLVSKGIDTAVYNAIMKKQDFSLAIYGKEDSDKSEDATTLFGEEFSDGLQ